MLPCMPQVEVVIVFFLSSIGQLPCRINYFPSSNSFLDLLIGFFFFFVGGRVAYSVGANFTPHVITINAGEVLMSIS